MSSWSSSDGTAPPQPARPVLRRAAASLRSLLLRVAVCPPPAPSCAPPVCAALASLRRNPADLHRRPSRRPHAVPVAMELLHV